MTGFVGNFSVKIRRKARFVDEDKCTGCGACTEKCPVKNVPDAYNLGLSNRHAAYIPFAQAIPNVAVLDSTRCIKLTKGKRFSINVISKSGTTTETALAFRVLRKLLEDSVGVEEANKRIYATTDRAKGTLKQLATEQGWPTFVVPDDVGGRYSVLTAVGLLPIACAGIDIDELMQGAADGLKKFGQCSIDNDAYRYAMTRNILYRKGKSVETLACFAAGLHHDERVVQAAVRRE